jgi:glutaredoxin-like protein
MTVNSPLKIIMYGTTWCGVTKRARRFFEEEKIEYDWVDIDKDESAARYVESVANGFRSVPTIVFPDGTILVEPSTSQLREKLGI